MSTNRVTVRLMSHGLACWHIVEISPLKMPLVKRLEAGEDMDVASLGRVIESGWGTPPTATDDSIDYTKITS